MKKTNLNIIIIFSLIGVLFSGYLTFTKLVLGSCPLREGCPYFLGYPACIYGLALFLTLFILAILTYKNAKLMKAIFYVSLLGIIFASYTTYTEYTFPSCLNGVCEYSLLLPTCVYGLFMYLVIFINSIIYLKREHE